MDINKRLEKCLENLTQRENTLSKQLVSLLIWTLISILFILLLILMLLMLKVRVEILPFLTCSKVCWLTIFLGLIIIYILDALIFIYQVYSLYYSLDNISPIKYKKTTNLLLPIIFVVSLYLIFIIVRTFPYIDSIPGNLFTCIITPISIFISYKLGKFQGIKERCVRTLTILRKSGNNLNTKEDFQNFNNILEDELMFAHSYIPFISIDNPDIYKFVPYIFYSLFIRKYFLGIILEYSYLTKKERLDILMESYDLEQSKINANKKTIINHLIYIIEIIVKHY